MSSRIVLRGLSIFFLLMMLISFISIGIAEADKEVIAMVEGFAYEEKEYPGSTGPGKVWYQYPWQSSDKFEIMYTAAGYVYKITSVNALSIYGFGHPHLYDASGNYIGPEYYELKVKIKMESEGCGGIIIRVQKGSDGKPVISEDNQYSGYIAEICYGPENSVHFYLSKSPATPHTLGSSEISADHDKWYYLSLRFEKGNKVVAKLWGNGVDETLTYVDDDPLPPGAFGVYAGGFLEIGKVYFDAVWLTVIIPEAETVTTTLTSTTTKTEVSTITATSTVTETIGGGGTVTETVTTTETATVSGGLTMTETVTETTTETAGTITTTTYLTQTTTLTETSTEMSTPSPGGEFDFDVTVTPSTLALKPSQSTSAVVTVKKISGNPQPVTLMTAGLPSDFTVTFNPPVLEPDGASVLMIKAGASPGTYTVVIQAQGGGKMKQAQLRVTVEEEKRCLIATAAFGSEIAPQVQVLRGFRDGFVAPTFAGGEFLKVFNAFYYSWSPYVAGVERQNPPLRELIKIAIYPLIFSLEASRLAAQPFSTWPEFAVLVSGITASILIGLIYLSPPLLVVFLLARHKRREWSLKPIHIIPMLPVSLTLYAAAEAAMSPILMAFSSSAVVLSSIILGAIIPTTIIKKKQTLN